MKFASSINLVHFPPLKCMIVVSFRGAPTLVKFPSSFTSTHIINVAAGSCHSVLLNSQGQVYTFGSNQVKNIFHFCCNNNLIFCVHVPNIFSYCYTNFILFHVILWIIVIYFNYISTKHIFDCAWYTPNHFYSFFRY